MRSCWLRLKRHDWKRVVIGRTPFLWDSMEVWGRVCRRCGRRKGVPSTCTAPHRHRASCGMQDEWLDK